MSGENAQIEEVTQRYLLKRDEFRQGFADYSAGSGAPHEYDDWCTWDQCVYEEGRLVAAELSALGYPIGCHRGWKSIVLYAYGEADSAESTIARKYIYRPRSAA